MIDGVPAPGSSTYFYQKDIIAFFAVLWCYLSEVKPP